MDKKFNLIFQISSRCYSEELERSLRKEFMEENCKVSHIGVDSLEFKMFIKEENPCRCKSVFERIKEICPKKNSIDIYFQCNPCDINYNVCIDCGKYNSKCNGYCN